jgi:UDP-N-acetylmuramoylalanine--D-glutamate ligase
MMILHQFKDQPLAVFGLGSSGIATALSLQQGGAMVYAYDDNEISREKARKAGVSVHDFRGEAWQTLILSPGVPLTHPEPHWSVIEARKRNADIIGDLELFYREIAGKAKIIAITGTNGKSTVTALIGHILKKLGENVQVGGNIGKAVLTLDAPTDKTIYVIECSSFQIDLAPSFTADIAILTNITPDHLDRHGTMENYTRIKTEFVMRAETCLFGELPFDYDLTGIASLRGEHNRQNAMFAVNALADFPHAKIQAALKTFPGLPHRMEQVGQKGDVLFINDSKATNADSTEKALLSFKNIYWIAGGKAKEGGIEPLRAFFPSIIKTYLIGASSNDFAKSLDGYAYDACETLENALNNAYNDAKGKEAVILLSPACASYDQFANFEVRGDMFRAMVQKSFMQHS